MEQLLVGIQAQDNATPVLEKFKKSITDVTKQFDDVTKGADKFGSSMLEQAKKLPVISDSCSLLSKSLELIKSPFLQIPVLAGAAVTSLIAFSNSNMKTVTELKRMSETTGISVNALAALKKVGAQTETSFESIVGAVTKLEKNMGESGKSFKKLGVEGREPIEVLGSLADRFKATTDPVERARLGFLAFGKSWSDMAPMLAQGGEAIRKAQESTTISEAMVARYEKMHRDQLAISGAAGAWKSALGDLASGPLAMITGMLADMAKKSAEVAKNIRAAINKEADAEFAEKWFAGSNEVAQAKLKGTSASVAKRSGNGGLDIQAHAAASTSDVRNQWAIENFKKLSLDEQESIVNGYANKGTHQLLNDLTETTIAQMKASVEKLKREKDKILGQADKEGETKERRNAELRLFEMLSKAKDKLAIDQTKEELERNKLAEQQDYQNKVEEAKKAFNAIKGASVQDKQNLNALLETLEQDHNQKLLDIQAKYEEEQSKKDIKQLEARIKTKADEIRQAETQAKKYNDILKLQEEDYIANLEDGKEKELAILRDKYLDDLKLYTDNEKAKAIIESRYNAQKAALDKKFLDKEKKEYRDQFKGLGDIVERSLSSSYGNFIKEVTRGNQSLGTSFKHLGKSIKDNIGNALVESISDWLAKKAAMYATDFAMFLANVVKTKAVTQAAQTESIVQAETTGSAIAAANAPAAGLASIASWGGAAVAGGAALIATMALASSYHATGTEYAYGGLTMVGERGPELVNLPRGSQVINNDKTNALVGGGDTHYNITLNNTGVTPKQVVRELKMYDRENKRTRRV